MFGLFRRFEKNAVASEEQKRPSSKTPWKAYCAVVRTIFFSKERKKKGDDEGSIKTDGQ